MRGLSIIELLIALAIFTMALTATTLISFQTPFMVSTLAIEARAFDQANDFLSRAERNPSLSSGSIAARTYARAVWSDTHGRRKSLTLSVPLVGLDHLTESCDPLVSGNWKIPHILTTYQVKDLISSSSTTEQYPVSDLAASGTTLAIAVHATANATSSTLFFFRNSNGTLSPISSQFDNAPSSTVGFSALATGDGYLYAGNGFGSASQATCSDGVSCAQVQVFSIAKGTISRVSTLQLPTSAEPFARDSSGSSATVRALMYKDGYLYIGLAKTDNGNEFIIADAHDPAHLRYVGSAHIGRSVNAIGIQGTYVYLGTDDNAQELAIYDVHDPMHPVSVGGWDAPGSNSFGYGDAIDIRDTRLLFGRSYVSNAPELALLDISTTSTVVPLATDDIGVAKAAQSVRRIIRQDFLAFVLGSTQLRIYSLGNDSATLAPYAAPLTLPTGSNGVALACIESTMYVGSTQADGSGAIEVVQST